MAIHKIHYEEGDVGRWLEIRNSMSDRLGGSEIGTVAGHSPYNSAFALFCQKCGAAPTPILKKKEAVIQGHDGEEIVARRFEREMGKRVHRENCIITNDAYPRLKASVDRMIYGEKSGLECKTAKDMVMKKYKHGDFPMSYFDQCLLYLAVTGMERWYLAIMVFGTAFRMFMMTTVKAEAERYEVLKKKFVEWEDFKRANYIAWTWNDDEKKFIYEGEDAFTNLNVPDSIKSLAQDEDLTEWERNWCKLEAVYYVDAEEFNAAEELAETFLKRVENVKDAMKDWKPEGEIADDEVVLANARKSALIVAVNQVWPRNEIDGSDATSAVVSEIAPEPVEDSVITLDEKDGTFQLVLKRDELDKAKKKIEKQIGEVENQISVSVGEAETVKMPGWKITYKLGAARETASAAKVKDWFANNGKEVPVGMISVSTPKRSLRFWEQKENKSKSKQ